MQPQSAVLHLWQMRKATRQRVDARAILQPDDFLALRLAHRKPFLVIILVIILILSSSS